MPVRPFLAIGVVIALGATATSAQLWSRGDQLTLTINHPAPVKASLDHVAFAKPEGPCSADLSDALVADFATSGKLVIDRLHLQQLIAEHKLNVSGLVDAKTAAKIGKLIGTGSLVFIRVHECKAYHVREPNHTIDLKGNISKEEVPTTRGALKAAVQIVDLQTGVTVAARVIDAKVAVQMEQGASLKERFLATAQSLRGQGDKKDPGDYPPDDQAMSALYNEAVKQVHRAMLPWSESKKITFYDDRDCGLNAAYALVQSSDYAGAAREARSALERCEASKPPQKARAHFNLGMALFLTEDYLAAMKELGEAQSLDASNKAIQPAMQDCSRAWAASQSEGIAQKTPPPSVASTGAPKSATTADSGKGSSTVEERLKRLDDLHKKKVITDDEYARKRKEILDAM